MLTASHLGRIVLAIALLGLLLAPASLKAQNSVADRILLDAANRDRSAAGLPALRWDSALAAAAHQHALRMAQANQLSHQFPGEPAVQDRARQTGARFSTIAENVAQGPSRTRPAHAVDELRSASRQSPRPGT